MNPDNELHTGSQGHGLSPATARRRLAGELNRMRLAAQLSSAAVVKHCGWSTSKLIRVENSSVSVSVSDVMALGMLYGVAENRLKDLVELARAVRRRPWWYESRQVWPALATVLGFEADAARIRVFAPTVVPELWQTPAYARAIAALSPSKDPGHVEDMITLQMQRQQQVLHGPLPPEIVAILDESVLYRRVGGAQTMADQIDRLIAAAGPDVSVAVMPFSAGAYATTTAFTLMDFRDPTVDDAVICLDDGVNAIAAQNTSQVTRDYGDWFDHMLKCCLQGDDAAQVLDASRTRHLSDAP